MCEDVVIHLCPICDKGHLEFTKSPGRFSEEYTEVRCPRCQYHKKLFPDGSVMSECVDYYPGLNPIKARINYKAIKKFYED